MLKGVLIKSEEPQQKLKVSMLRRFKELQQEYEKEMQKLKVNSQLSG